MKVKAKKVTRKPKLAPAATWWRNLKATSSTSAHDPDLDIVEEEDGNPNCFYNASSETPSSSGEMFSRVGELYPFRCLYFDCLWAFVSQALVTEHIMYFHLFDLDEKCDMNRGLKLDDDRKFNMSDEMDLLEDVLGKDGFVGFPRDSEETISSVSVPLSVEFETELNNDVDCSSLNVMDAVENGDGNLGTCSGKASTVSTDTDFVEMGVDYDITQFKLGSPPQGWVQGGEI